MSEVVASGVMDHTQRSKAAHRLSFHRYRLKLLIMGGLVLGLSIVVIASAVIGAVGMTFQQMMAILLSKVGFSSSVEYTHAQEAVLLSIRLPRVVLGVLVGGTLGICGATIQGLFRNPLAEPGLIGTSGGAAMMAVLAIVFLGTLPGWVPAWVGRWTVPLGAFIGGLATTMIVFKLSSCFGKVQISTMLLAGIAVNSLAGAIVGVAIFFADDAEIRSVTFWSLGSIAGATWKGLLISGPLMFFACITLPWMARALNALALGEAEAHHLGIPVERVRRLSIALVAIAVGAAVSLSGIVGFVGLVVPHLMRMLLGPDHGWLLPASALSGAMLLLGSDLIARTIASPAELPLGVVTALLGSPYFLWLLIRARKSGRWM